MAAYMTCQLLQQVDAFSEILQTRDELFCVKSQVTNKE